MSESIRRDGAHEDRRGTHEARRSDGRTPSAPERPSPSHASSVPSVPSVHVPAGCGTAGPRALAPTGLREASAHRTAAPGDTDSSPTPHRAVRTDASPAPGDSGGAPTAAGHGPYGKEYDMIQQIVHEPTDTVDATTPAGLAQALTVAKDLHSPAHRTPDVVAVPQLMGLRISAERPHRYKVPLKRITAMAA